MENYLEEIKIKLKKNIKLEEIDVVDNSHLHSKHKFFDKNKKHLKIIIKSSFLKNLNKIESHKNGRSYLWVTEGPGGPDTFDNVEFFHTFRV